MIYAVIDLYMAHCNLRSGWGILLVDATNAFTSLNCTVKKEEYKMVYLMA